MPKKVIPPLATAAAKLEEQKKRRGVLGAIGALLGLPDKAVAKMTKVTEKYSERHEKVEESDEEEESEPDTGSDADTEDSTGSGSTSSTSGEEEESESSDGGEEEEASTEEEEEKAAAKVAKAHKRAMAAAQAAYDAAALKFGPELAGSLALRSPDRLFREARKVTGATSVDDVMTGLSRMRSRNEQASAKAIKATAKLENRVAKVETESRKSRVDAMVEAAKVSGRASTRELRAHLREHGMAHGTKALAALVAGLPVTAPTREKIAKANATGEAVGLPSTEEQERMMQQAMAGLSEKDREIFKAEAANKLKALNGAGSRE